MGSSDTIEQELPQLLANDLGTRRTDVHDKNAPMLRGLAGRIPLKGPR